MGLTMLDKISINLYDILTISKFWQVMAVKMKPYWSFLSWSGIPDTIAEKQQNQEPGAFV